MSSPIEQSVIAIIAEQTGKDPSELNVDQSWTDLGFDSLEQVETVMALEDKHDIVIPEETAENITTIRQLVDYIESNTNESAAN